MGTVTKALSLLGLFSHARLEMGLSELTRLSGMNKATVYRMMSELQAAGFVEQLDGDRAYRLGSELLRLAALREAAVPLLSVSREVLRHLCEVTGETSHMSLQRDGRLTTLTHAYSSRHGTRVAMEDAEILSFHATGSGLAYLAFAAPGFAEEVLSGPLTRHTPETETNPDRLRAALDEARRTGIAESVGGFEADVHSHAAPIFGPDQTPIGALAVAAPVSRMTPELKALIRAEIKSSALALTQRIGGFCPASYPA
ncbi:IclR family transcriptional regulator [Ruegeria aquimaris]|uniref:IclR family transcriptional regulator n=1 Tax=Ruegeria aquimaris TaxID=2984333 RepID=A0ABT3AGV1_9RHOB|nr:IclR family transcriptional regulator [Ruegeria sp. XHP0148]MCV2887855.1 IclR family transcriptional regulator [Ruegeria sp. XHP0148]